MRKEIAPAGWHVPSDVEWTTLENYFITNNHNYDDSKTGNKLAKAMSSTTELDTNSTSGSLEDNQSTNKNREIFTMSG
ncbi:MAG: FISUMP domain-containing protein [Flavobacteriaceae bacterium]|nr:fibrobacter succinogenes major paralogous domain-containing protein [Flavobacteriaceae bacterium]MDG1384851.1 FISUMP domain-containing protein [Flavobacteriaceae bacterium]